MRFTRMFVPICVLLLVLNPCLGWTVEADSENDENSSSGTNNGTRSPDVIASELNSPINSLFFLDTDVEFRTYSGNLPGSDDQTSWAFKFTGSYPFMLNNGKSIQLRATVPLFLDQPTWVVDFGHPIWELDTDYQDFRLRQSPWVTADSGGYGHSHDYLGDITLDAAYGGISENGFISMYGLATVLPTAQDLSASRDQWLLGPEIALGKQSDWGVYGVKAMHLTRISGEDRWDTNETTFDVFFAYGLGNGWQLVSNPSILYDWEADSGNELLLPLGGGVAKTFRAGSTSMRLAAELYYYAVTPDRLGTEWLFKLRFTPVFMDRSSR